MIITSLILDFEAGTNAEVQLRHNFRVFRGWDRSVYITSSPLLFMSGTGQLREGAQAPPSQWEVRQDARPRLGKHSMQSKASTQILESSKDFLREESEFWMHNQNRRFIWYREATVETLKPARANSPARDECSWWGQSNLSVTSFGCWMIFVIRFYRLKFIV